MVLGETTARAAMTAPGAASTARPWALGQGLRTKGPVDVARTLLPPIDDFLRDVEALASSLGPRLRIPDELLDGTPESLDAVDEALKRIPWAKRQVPDLVTPLVAYLGEVMRRGSGGRWSKSQSPGHENEPDDHHARRGALPAVRQRVPPDGRAQPTHPAALLARRALPAPAQADGVAGSLTVASMNEEALEVGQRSVRSYGGP